MRSLWPGQILSEFGSIGLLASKIFTQALASPWSSFAILDSVSPDFFLELRIAGAAWL
jgi:hypothetical protein